MRTETDDEAPLDPVLENVRRKLVRRMAWSLGIMMIGLMAILGAIVYKIGFQGDKNSLVGVESPHVVALPEGAVVEETNLDGDRILMRVRLATGELRLIVLSLKTGQTLSSLSLQ